MTVIKQIIEFCPLSRHDVLPDRAFFTSEKQIETQLTTALRARQREASKKNKIRVAVAPKTCSEGGL